MNANEYLIKIVDKLFIKLFLVSSIDKNGWFMSYNLST